MIFKFYFNRFDYIWKNSFVKVFEILVYHFHFLFQLNFPKIKSLFKKKLWLNLLYHKIYLKFVHPSHIKTPPFSKKPEKIFANRVK